MYHIHFPSLEQQKLLITLMKDVRENMREDNLPTPHTI